MYISSVTSSADYNTQHICTVSLVIEYSSHATWLCSVVKCLQLLKCCKIPASNPHCSGFCYS